MSIQKIIQESINENPLEMKEALIEELKSRIAEALAAKMEEVELDESVSFKKTETGDHHIHHNGNPVGKIIKTSSMGSNGYSVRIGGNTAKHEVGTESSLAAAKDSAKWHLTSSESPVKMKEEVELDEISKKTLGSYVKKSADDLTHIQRDIGDTSNMKSPEYKKLSKTRSNRKAGINLAVNRLTKEEVEQIDEIGDTPAGRKALKAVIARAPEKAANSRLRSDVLGRRQFDPDVSSADSERYGHAADKHYKKYQLAVKGAARAVDRLTKEEVDLGESSGIHDIKSLQKHFEAPTAYDAAAHSPAMMKRKGLDGKKYDLIKVNNGKYKAELSEESDLDEAADKPSHQYYATTQYMRPSEMKILHDKKKPFATEKEAFDHIKKQGGRQDGTIHKVHTATGKIVSLRHVAGGQAGYVSDVGRGDPKHLSELPK